MRVLLAIATRSPRSTPRSISPAAIAATRSRAWFQVNDCQPEPTGYRNASAGPDWATRSRNIRPKDAGRLARSSAVAVLGAEVIVVLRERGKRESMARYPDITETKPSPSNCRNDGDEVTNG